MGISVCFLCTKRCCEDQLELLFVCYCPIELVAIKLRMLSRDVSSRWQPRKPLSQPCLSHISSLHRGTVTCFGAEEKHEDDAHWPPQSLERIVVSP